jgi:hypothetical protein
MGLEAWSRKTGMEAEQSSGVKDKTGGMREQDWKPELEAWVQATFENRIKGARLEHRNGGMALEGARMENDNGGMAKQERKIGPETRPSRKEGPNWTMPE